MERHARVYKAQELLLRVQRMIKDLHAVERDIAAYLNEIEKRRVDNRSALESILKLDLNIGAKKRGGKNA